MKAKSRSVKSVLQEALAYLERQGWCQHCLQAHNGKVCLDGAVRYAIWGDPLHPCHTVNPTDTHRHLYIRVTDRLWTIQQRSITEWNDAPKRTWREVKTLLTRLIREAR